MIIDFVYNINKSQYFRLHYLCRGHLDPTDFHTFNIILHVAVSVLTLFIFNLLLGPNSRNVAFYAAALFAVHPVHAEAVSFSLSILSD